MAIKITGKVYNLRQTEKSVFCGIQIYNSAAKVGAFLNAQFIRDAFEPATRLENKDKVEILDGFITADAYKRKGEEEARPNLKLIVYEFNNLTNPGENGEGDFHPAEDENSLPF